MLGRTEEGEGPNTRSKIGVRGCVNGADINVNVAESIKNMQISVEIRHLILGIDTLNNWNSNVYLQSTEEC